MDTNWCMVCGKHIDCPEEVTYCSEACRHSDSSMRLPVSSSEYFSLRSPAASPVSSPTWAPHAMFRERSSSLTPTSARDLSARYPCHTPAYSSSRSSLVLIHHSPSLGPSTMDANGRATSLPSTHQLTSI
ncbi:hypothetical protein COEREDRAFT_79110 [Coemansia reversa NRRL 1564]|uniref:Uncharacterized protein n=1 Tax=Coemansia reversa (strain ATCC 12441 / NRRL 1564) TaxID=763665 RepID=A0A2G5BJI1_COERN|nr:hypothetical protein COEREDRAFT_79110 [Coemansia reversa NRRL 1564]|eukprot:PIA19132.1 hypothetical protein COEREDRAFT_79110 [Coemansia reversa NRRL 1564]